MGSPYVGEIRMFAGNFAPAGWEFCSGQLLPISENETLFTLIGTTYGGDGQSTFALPNLQSRVPVHMGTSPFGTNRVIGEAGGAEQVTLTTQQIPAHTHPFSASSAAASGTAPSSTETLGVTVGFDAYVGPSGLTAMSNQTVSAAGGSQPHENVAPFLCINFIISLFGIFPSQ